MEAVTSDYPAGSRTRPDTVAIETGARAIAFAGPNVLVRWAFYLSAFAIPFMLVYLPGTGDRLGVMRVVQLLLLGAMITQPRVCLRLIPAALVWFAVYCVVRVVWGLWLSPDWSHEWWPSTLQWFQYLLPWTWITFNVLQFPQTRRAGLWAFAIGCSLCALLHIAGIGVAAVDNNIEEVRTSVFGMNANMVGATYATALITLIGLGMFKDMKLSHRLVLWPLIGLVGIGLAKTGSRTAVLMVARGVFVLLFQANAFSSKARRYGTLLVIGAVLALAVAQSPMVLMRFQKVTTNIQQQEARVRMFPVLWEIFLRSPLYGSGPDQYQFELTRRAMPYLVRDQKMIVSHNLVLLLLVETGVIGFAIFSTGLWKTLTSAWRARRNSGGLLPLALLVPFIVAGLILSNPTPHYTFWLVVAYALAGAA
jgi:hypothetical protein